MIFRNDLLNHTSKEIRKALKFLESSSIYDLFIVAAKEEDLQEFESFEKRQKAKILKQKWIPLIKEGKGVIFFVTSNMFFRKKSKSILNLIDLMKEFGGEELEIDSIEKHQKFDVFFISHKSIQNDANQTL